MADKSERWRGVTFTTKRLTVSNVTETEQTAFWIMASYPTTLDWTPTLFRHEVRVLRLAIRPNVQLGADDILRGLPPTAGIVLEDRVLAENDVVALITGRPLTAILPGKYPVAAYIPVEQSRVSITQKTSTFIDHETWPTIREEYPASSVRVGHSGNVITGGELLAYPMMDFVGPDTILVTDDPAAEVVAKQYTGVVNCQQLADMTSVTAIVVKSPFSTRLSAMPFGDLTNPVTFKAPIPEPAPSEFREPDRPARPLGPNEVVVEVGGGPVELPTEVLPRKRGQMEITVLEPLNSTEYAYLEKSLRESDIVRTDVTRSRAPEPDHSGMSFRYPPIPPHGGFNIFGLLAELTLHVRTGRLMVGSTLIPIEVPSTLAFKDIRVFTPERNVVPIPLTVTGKERAVDFNLEATSKLTINGAPVKLDTDSRRAVTEYALMLAALIQGIAAVVTIWPRGKSPAVTAPSP